MSIIDYGVVVKKNGNIIQTELYMNMKKAVGFTIDSIQYQGCKIRINDEYFSYIGDKELLLCIYKRQLVIIENCDKITTIHGLDTEYSLPYNIQRKVIEVGGVEFKIKRLVSDNERFKVNFTYKGDKYECIYGYGVDVNKKIWYYANKKEKRMIYRWFNE